MANRDYKNIKRFVDNLSAQIEETMEGGGGGESSIAPYVIIKTGAKLKVDFSVGTYFIDDYTWLFNNDKTAWDPWGMDLPRIEITKNEGNTKLLAHFYFGSYTEPTSDVIIYEGNVSGINNTSSIASELPVVEFTMPELDYSCVTLPHEDYSVTN